jgi:all-trans-retinol 13,14-reductase
LTTSTVHTARRVRASLPTHVDVAIVGCGLGGLQAGALLAKAGLKVACFDQHYVAGGCATMFDRGRSDARYRFDVGLHYVGDCGHEGAIPTLLRQSGVEVEWIPMDPEGFDTLVFPGLTFRIPVGHERYRQRLHETFPREKKGIDRYVDFLLQVDRVTRRMDGQKGRMGLGSLVDLALNGRLVAKYREATIAQVLDDCTRDPLLRAVMLGQTGDYGVAPKYASAVLHAGLANHYFRGAYYPKGGGQVPADRLAEVIEDHGGSIHLRHGVERILVQGDRAVGVKLEPKHGESEGQEVRARFVLSNADLKRTLLELVGPEHLPPEWLQRAQGFQMGGALFLTVLGIHGTLPSGATNWWQFDGTDLDAFYDTTGPDGSIQPRGCYVTSAGWKDPGTSDHAPAGHLGVEVMTLVPGSPQAWGVQPEAFASGACRHNPLYQQRKQAVEDDMVRRLDALFPGAAARVVLRESASPLTHTRYTRASDGTGYGLAAIPSQFLQNRPGYRGPLQGLYLAGGSTRAGHGIVGALTSGTRAAERVLREVQGK